MVKRRTRTEAEPHVLPAHLPIFVADAPKVCICRKSPTRSKMQDILGVDKMRNDSKCHILTLRDKGAMSGENGISSSSANVGRSVEHWRRLALLRSHHVEPNPGPPQARSRGGGELLSTFSTFFFLWLVQFACPRRCCSRFNPWDHSLPLWNMDESSHRHLSMSTQIYQAMRLWMPVCWSWHTESSSTTRVSTTQLA